MENTDHPNEVLRILDVIVDFDKARMGVFIDRFLQLAPPQDRE